MPILASGTFINASGVPSDGAIINAWNSNRFGSPPAYNDAPPVGSPDAGPVTTDESFGAPGAFTITVPTSDSYYLSADWDGFKSWIYWSPGAGQGTNTQTLTGSVSGTATLVEIFNEDAWKLYVIDLDDYLDATVGGQSFTFLTPFTRARPTWWAGPDCGPSWAPITWSETEITLPITGGLAISSTVFLFGK